jgi:CBS domain containing-hemolysin-like protein
MTTGDVALVLGALACVLAAGFFGAAQAALTRMSLNRARKISEEGLRGSAHLVRLMEDPSRTLNLLALLVLAMQVTGVALLTVVASRFLGEGLAILVAVLGGLAALFVGGEVAPKTLAVQQTDRVARLTAPALALLARPLAPVASVLVWLGNLATLGRGLEKGPFVTEEVLRDMIDVAESDEVIEETERAMIHSIFELGDTVVREIMVPRPDMVLVSVEDRLPDVLDVILQAGHSRIPVYDGDRDRIVGLIYAKDVLSRLHTGGDPDEPWGDLMRPPYFIPELKQVDSLLRELQSEKVHLAVVVDEYGATVGLVTIEDILEEIVGEIVDEYDREEPLIEQLPSGGVRVDARLPVDDLEELLTCDLPDKEWDTVGGLLFGLLGHVPTPGEHVDVDGVRLTAERVQGRRIAKVLVDRVEPLEGSAEGPSA